MGAVNSIPSTVGGGGTHADGKVPRFRPEDFRLHSTYGPVDDAAVADWPVDYDELEPYYAEVERLVGVAGHGGGQPLRRLAVGSLPDAVGGSHVRRRAVVGGGRAVRGCIPIAAPTAANSVPYDGRPACNNCGHCAYFGCPIHAKGDPVAMLQHALVDGPGRAAVGDVRLPAEDQRAGGHRRRRHRPRRGGADARGALRGGGRRGHRDTAAAAAVGDRASRSSAAI